MKCILHNILLISSPFCNCSYGFHYSLRWPLSLSLLLPTLLWRSFVWHYVLFAVKESSSLFGLKSDHIQCQTCRKKQRKMARRERWMCFTLPLKFFLLYSTSQDMNQRALDSPHWRPNQTFLHLTSTPSKLLLFWLLRPSNITPVPYALVSYPAVCTLLQTAEQKWDLKRKGSKAEQSSCNIEIFITVSLLGIP